MPATPNQNTTTASAAVSATITPSSGKSNGTATATATQPTLGSVTTSAGNKQNVGFTFGWVILALGMAVILH